MLSDRSPKSTKEVAKKLEGAQLRDEQTVRSVFFFFRLKCDFLKEDKRTAVV